MSEPLPRGTIYTLTEIGRDAAPTGFVGLAPYSIAIVELEGGLRLTGRLTDWGDKAPEIGQAVEMVTRRQGDNSDERGIIRYGYAFRPPIEVATPEQVEAMKRATILAMQGIFE